MLFNSIEFAIFVPIVFILYWFVTSHNLKLQNVLLIVASYFYYAWWDWRFLSLLIFNSFVGYTVGIALSKQDDPKKRKWLLFTNILISIGLLGYFKYYNFFVESFVDAFSFFGYKLNARTLNIILPIGISFYTFQILSYAIDVYRRKFEPTRDIISFFAYTSFFPVLLAGPIERPGNLLSQLYVKRKFDYDKAVDGMRQILWGLFKKMVIADNCARYVNDIFNNYADYSGSTLLLGAILFAVQIYGDFSGYSDMAIGTARLFGINLMRNFAFPLFSKSIAEFWRRWHISLSSWLFDYLYTPITINRRSWGIMSVHFSLFVTFVVIGLWHGANWTFIIFGILQGLWLSLDIITRKSRKRLKKIIPAIIYDNISMLITFSFFSFSMIFFKANNIQTAIHYISRLSSASFISKSQVLSTKLILGILIFIFVEWIQRDKQHALQIENIKVPSVVRWGIYYSIVLVIIMFGSTQQEFIYFRF